MADDITRKKFPIPTKQKLKDNYEYYKRDKISGKLIPYKKWVKLNPYAPFRK